MQSTAVHHTEASRSTARAGIENALNLRDRLLRHQAMQIDAQVRLVVAAPEFTQLSSIDTGGDV
jgi:hypothetical protein